MNSKELNRSALRRASVIFFWIVFLALAGLYFTNDFGLIDLHKTSIIAAVAIDTTEKEVQVTAQIAVPKPSQSGEHIEYTEVQGSGETIADALNEVNAKTGFYPQLHFCKLVLLGESCKEKNLFQLLGCFYRKNYSELTALVAMCDGNAAKVLGMPVSTSDMTSSVVQRVLADELKKSANVSSVDLKDIAVAHFSKSKSCYMPYVEVSKEGTSQEGGNGDNVGGEKPESGSSGGGESGGGSGGSSSGSSGGGESGGGGSSGGSSGGGGGEEKVEFTARRTAIFSEGMFAGILDEQQSFAVDILKNQIRQAILPCDAGGLHYSLGLRSTDKSINLKVKNGVPTLTLKFKALAQIAGVRKVVDPKETASDDKLSPEIIEGAEKEVKRRMANLIETCKKTDCDVLGIRELLYKFNNREYENFKDDVLQKMQIEYEISIRSVN